MLGVGLALVGCNDSNDPVVQDPPAPAPTNTAPEITSTALITVEAGSEYSYSLAASDADNDTLTLSASTLPDWLSFDVGTGTLSGTPTAEHVGEHNVVLAVSDGTDETTQAFVITVTAANTAPQWTSTAVTTASVGSEYSYTLAATDADGDDLTYSAETIPAWLTFNSSTQVLSGTPVHDDVGDHSVVLKVSDGEDDATQNFTIAVASSVAENELLIFGDAANPAWPAWDCCSGTTPEVVADDAEHNMVTEFTIVGDTVAGFSAREDAGAVDGMPFDASAFAQTGTLSFDLKMTTSPGDTDWKVKVESQPNAEDVSTFAELSLSSSQQAHAAPELDTWQTYTFNLADFAAAGLDLSAIDVVLMFPQWGSGDGAVYRVDNVMISEDGYVAPPEQDAELVVFDEVNKPEWLAWDCCTGTTPAVVADDANHNNVMEFMITGDTVMGFSSRADHGAVGGVPFDATGISAEGTLAFDLKMTSAPDDASAAWKLKLESNNSAEQFVELDLTSAQEGHSGPVLDTWQTYTFNISALQSGSTLDLAQIDVIMVFPAWGQGAGATYRIDNMKFYADGAETVTPPPSTDQIDLPLDFESTTLDYVLTDFDGSASELVDDPFASNGKVAKTVKTVEAVTWAGTTMGDENGFANAVPLTTTNSVMKVWVYSPDANIPVRLKIEDHNDATHTVETEAMVTVANEWQQLTFDFNNEAEGTVELNPEWTFDKASIFFNFGTDGATAGEKVYYWDQVTFGN